MGNPHVCVCVYIYIYIYIYIHIYTHLSIHTHVCAYDQFTRLAETRLAQNILNYIIIA